MTSNGQSGPDSPNDFLNSNYKIIAIIGVFAALTIYLFQLSSEGYSVRLAYAGAMFVFIVNSFIFVHNVLAQFKASSANTPYFRKFKYRLFYGIILGSFVLILIDISLILILNNLDVIVLITVYSVVIITLLSYADYFYVVNNFERRFAEHLPVSKGRLLAVSSIISVLIFIPTMIYI